MADLLQLCKAMNAVRKKLNHDMLQVLLEEKWQENAVTKALSEASVGLIKAMRAIEKPTTLESAFLAPDWPADDEDDEDDNEGVS